jgi:hypothetical protein
VAIVGTGEPDPLHDRDTGVGDSPQHRVEGSDALTLADMDARGGQRHPQAQRGQVLGDQHRVDGARDVVHDHAPGHRVAERVVGSDHVH